MQDFTFMVQKTGSKETTAEGERDHREAQK